MKGKLYLIPSTLGDNAVNEVIPIKISEIINTIYLYIVENERTARRYLKKLGIIQPIDDLKLYLLDKHTSYEVMSNYLEPAESGMNIGVLSEAGCPAVADPGSEIVKLAHKKGIQVIPLVGPSSIILALMASGLNGQNFAFHGYLPIKKPDLIKKLRSLETRSLQEKQTQIFIETPYRNQQLIQDILTNCHPSTMLCIGADLTLESEYIQTRAVRDWKSNLPDFNKRPAIFLLQKY
jgi:16S rRNA (cytidine1402-2'-O)-methyltransferase